MTKEEELARSVADLSGITFALTGLMVALLGHLQQNGLAHIVQAALDDANASASSALAALQPEEEALIAADALRRLADMRAVLSREMH